MLTKYQESVDAYKKALDINASSECHFNIAVAYNDTNQLEDAAHHYAMAAQLDLNNTDANLNLGNIYEQLGKVEQARSVYHTVIEKNPHNHAAAEALQRLGQ